MTAIRCWLVGQMISALYAYRMYSALHGNNIRRVAHITTRIRRLEKYLEGPK